MRSGRANDNETTGLCAPTCIAIPIAPYTGRHFEHVHVPKVVGLRTPIQAAGRRTAFSMSEASHLVSAFDSSFVARKKRRLRNEAFFRSTAKDCGLASMPSYCSNENRRRTPSGGHPRRADVVQRGPPRTSRNHSGAPRLGQGAADLPVVLE